MKNKTYHKQLQVVYLEFKKQPATMKMIDVRTGIDRANVCRYVSKFKKNNQIKLIKFGICPITKHRAGFYTTNKDLFNINDL